MNHNLPDVSSKYGAPMGRRECRHLDNEWPEKVWVRRIAIVDGGYDVGGAYWGTGAPLFRAYNDDLELDIYMRASNRDAAIAMVKADYPNVEIQPDLIDEDYREAFFDQYLESALSGVSDEEGNDVPCSTDDLDEDSKAKMKADCDRFIDANMDDLALALNDQDAGSHGHDFAMTRRGEGVGFWDGDYEKDVGDRLTKACKGFGEFYMYQGDDGKIYHG